jgi:hypothetical protein
VKQIADAKETATVDVLARPRKSTDTSLTVFATTTPTHHADAMSLTNAADHLLPRSIVTCLDLNRLRFSLTLFPIQ